MLRRTLAILIGTVLATVLPFCACVAATAGEVIGVSGQPTAGGNGREAPLKLGDPIQVGDTIVVPADAKLKLRMSDGSVISVASGSRMTVEDYAIDAATRHRDARLSLATGLVRAVVAVVSQPSTFEVDTATGVGAARSTDWFVQANPQSTEVAVLDGTVSLKGRDPRREVSIPARSGSRVNAGRDPSPPRPVSQAAFDALIAQTTVPPAAALGLCQCIENREALQFSCQPSAAACQTACASNQFSFVPYAPSSCTVTGPQ